MQVNRLFAFGMSWALAFGALVTPAHGQQQAAKVFIARPFFILSQMPQYKDLQVKFQAETAQLNAELDRKKKAVSDLVGQRANYKPDTPQYLEMSAKIDQAGIDLEAWQQMVQRQTEREKKRDFRDLWLKIEQATEIVAKKSNADLVLTDNRQDLPGVEDVSTYRDYMKILAERNVLFAGAQVDLSDQILLEIQKDHAAKEKAAGAGGGGAPGNGPAQQPRSEAQRPAGH